MILLFKTNKNAYGSSKGLKIDTTAKKYKCGYYTLSISELSNAIKISTKDYNTLINNLNTDGYTPVI